ncbi:MAG: DUF5312 domain-containing protein, partial [Treponema sp.]|nr:DUF5312 domain-containing protein [Treponema sp.]
FDNTLVGKINNCYNNILALVNFVSFDYFFLLKKFDPGLSERNFNYTPKFQFAKAADLTDGIKDFMEFSSAVEEDWDWKSTLAVLKTYKSGTDVVSFDQLSKIIRLLKDTSRSKILELIVQHITADTIWQSVPKIPDERMVDKILDAKKAEIDGALSKIQNDKRSAQIEQLAKTIFGSIAVERLENYINKSNDVFYKKNFDGFTKVAGINYLKAYLLDFFKKEVRELCDLLLVRGQWSNTLLSKPMSDACHEMLELVEKIAVLDDSLAEKGEHGSRLKQALLKVDRDKGQGKYIRIILRTVNNSAQRMINVASASLITIGKNFKNLLEDIQKKPAEIISNWKELESVSENPLAKRLADSYKRMYYFVQLLQFYSAPLEDEDTGPSSLG